jgi:glycosyltransferase involved in cell wall biosynthesis
MCSAYGEGFPNVVAEAMACETPCVVTDVGDAAAIVGTTGEVVPPRDPVRLGQAIVDVLSAPAATRAATGQHARARIAEHFSVERMVQAYSDIYGGLRLRPRS